MERIVKFMNVKSSDELCSYVYNHGNNPFFEIFKKEDIRKIDCDKSTWMRYNGYRWGVLKGSRAIYRDGIQDTCKKINIEYSELMRLAQMLDDAKKYAQNLEVPFLQLNEQLD